MSRAALAAAWILETAVFWIGSRGMAGPALRLPPWTRRDTAALAATLLVVPLLMAAPYRNLGGPSESGTKHYRAYFTADFVWHVALTSELGRFVMPPRNPYMEREALHYYWTYFLVPGRSLFTRPARRRRRRSQSQGQRNRDRGSADRVVLSARVVGRRRRRAHGGGRAPGCPRVERRRPDRHQGHPRARRVAGGAPPHQRRRDHRMEVQRPAHRRRAPHDVLHAAARPVLRARAAGARAGDVAPARRAAPVDAGLGPAPRAGDDDQPVPRRGVLAHLRAGGAGRRHAHADIGSPAGHSRRGGDATGAGDALGTPERDGRRCGRRVDHRVGRLRAQPAGADAVDVAWPSAPAVAGGAAAVAAAAGNAGARRRQRPARRPRTPLLRRPVRGVVGGIPGGPDSAGDDDDPVGAPLARLTDRSSAGASGRARLAGIALAACIFAIGAPTTAADTYNAADIRISPRGRAFPGR